MKPLLGTETADDSAAGSMYADPASRLPGADSHTELVGPGDSEIHGPCVEAVGAISLGNTSQFP